MEEVWYLDAVAACTIGWKDAVHVLGLLDKDEPRTLIGHPIWCWVQSASELMDRQRIDGGFLIAEVVFWPF